MGQVEGPDHGNTATTGTVDPLDHTTQRASPLLQAYSIQRAPPLSQADTTQRVPPLALPDKSTEPIASTDRYIDSRTPTQHSRASPRPRPNPLHRQGVRPVFPHPRQTP